MLLPPLHLCIPARDRFNRDLAPPPILKNLTWTVHGEGKNLKRYKCTSTLRVTSILCCSGLPSSEPKCTLVSPFVFALGGSSANTNSNLSFYLYRINRLRVKGNLWIIFRQTLFKGGVFTSMGAGTYWSSASIIPFSWAANCQNSSKIRVTILTPQISKLMSDGSTKPQIFAKKQMFYEIFK